MDGSDGAAEEGPWHLAWPLPAVEAMERCCPAFLPSSCWTRVQCRSFVSYCNRNIPFLLRKSFINRRVQWLEWVGKEVLGRRAAQQGGSSSPWELLFWHIFHLPAIFRMRKRKKLNRKTQKIFTEQLDDSTNFACGLAFPLEFGCWVVCFFFPDQFLLISTTFHICD